MKTLDAIEIPHKRQATPTRPTGSIRMTDQWAAYAYGMTDIWRPTGLAPKWGAVGHCGRPRI